MKKAVNTPALETPRLILRKFTERDIEALFFILKGDEVNKFLPWYPHSADKAQAVLLPNG